MRLLGQRFAVDCVADGCQPAVRQMLARLIHVLYNTSTEGKIKMNVSLMCFILNRTQGTQFDEFWEIYPIHNGGQVVALKAFKKALKVTTLEEILDGARRYRDDPNRAREFTAYPATWLNQQRWADPALPPQSLKDGRRSLREAPTIVPPKFTADDAPKGVPVPKNIRDIVRSMSDKS